MSGMVKEAIKRLLATICVMWLWETREASYFDDTWMMFYVYDDDLRINDRRMSKQKRIKIEFTIEDRVVKP